MTAWSGTVAAYSQSPPGKPWPSYPKLTLGWDGAATPTLTVTDFVTGTTDATVSGQALIQAGFPQSLLAAAAGGNGWEAGAA